MSVKCLKCQSDKVFLCSGGYYICDCGWCIKEDKYAEEAGRGVEAGEQERPE